MHDHLQERPVRFIFQNILTTCPDCKRDNISVLSTDVEPGLRLSRHFLPTAGRDLVFCDRSLDMHEGKR